MACQKNLASKFLKMCILAGLLPQQSISVSSSPGSSTHERCHPEDVLLSISSRGVALPWPAADGCLVHVDVNGVAQGSRYEARLSLVKQGLLVHEEWLQFQGADQQVPSQRISFAVPPVPAGRYTEYFDIYDACGLSTSLSASDEDDQRLHLLAGLNRAVDMEEAKARCRAQRSEQSVHPNWRNELMAAAEDGTGSEHDVPRFSITLPVSQCDDDGSHVEPHSLTEQPQLLVVLIGGRCNHPTATIIRQNALKIWELHPGAHILITFGLDPQDADENSSNHHTLRECDALLDLRTPLSSTVSGFSTLAGSDGSSKGHLDIILYNKSSCGAFEVGGIVAAGLSGLSADTFVFMQAHMWIENRIPDELFWVREFNEVVSRGGWVEASRWESAQSIHDTKEDHHEYSEHHRVIHAWRQERHRLRRGAACGFVPLWHFSPRTFNGNLDWKYAYWFMVGEEAAAATGFSEKDVRPFLADLVARTGLPWDPILDGDKDDESYNDFVFEHNNICGVFGNSFLASAAVVKHMHSKGVFNALRAVQLKYHTCMVELYFGYFGARELGCNACDVSLDGDMHEFEWTKNIHKHNGLFKTAAELDFTSRMCEGGFPSGKKFGKYWGGASSAAGDGNYMPCPPSYFQI